MAIKILPAIAFWIIGRWLIGRVIKLVQAAMHRDHIDATLTRCFGSIISVALNIALVLRILGFFGIQTTSIAAMLAGTDPGEHHEDDPGDGLNPLRLRTSVVTADHRRTRPTQYPQNHFGAPESQLH
jgi:hypothetical protein